MSHQSEAILENSLIQQLLDFGYTSVKVMDGGDLVSNLKIQLEAFNKTTFKKNKGCYSKFLYKIKKCINTYNS